MKRKINKVRELYYRVFVFVMVQLFVMVDDSYALSITDIIKKTADLLKGTAIYIGVGAGMIFGLIGVSKIRRKDDDPREFTKGIWFVVSGIFAAMIGILMHSILSYYGVASTPPTGAIDFTPGW
jgi:hypothetical protein